MLASGTIYAAGRRATTATLNQLIEEYGFPRNSLQGLSQVLEVLSHYRIDLDPPASEHDLDYERTLKPKRRDDEITREIDDILARGGENHSVELKSSIQIDRKRQYAVPGRDPAFYVNDNLATKLAQEICAFLNRDGGVILLGVANDLEVLGCEDDFSAFVGDGSPEDKSDLIIRQIVERNFVKATAALSRLTIECVVYKGKRIIVLRVAPSTSLLLLKKDCGSSCQLYLRIGTSAQPIHFEELEEYYELKLLP